MNLTYVLYLMFSIMGGIKLRNYVGELLHKHFT
jgi:hypothetical protein